MTGVTVTGDRGAERIRAAFERISRWMNAHGAPLLVENLAPGATPERLAQAETEFGAALPDDLRALWSLHDGQREEMNGFVESLDLLSVQCALCDREHVLRFVDFLREAPGEWGEAGITEAEAESNFWLPIAARDSDSIVVSGVTGRVFSCGKDSPPLRLLAASLAEWLDQYAARVVADDYAVEEGFGDYYLELRDREAERRQQERTERTAEHERFRRETPLLDQFRKGLASKDEDRCTEVLKDALDREDKDALGAAIALLFSAKAEPKFLAGTLGPMLKTVALGSDQWVDVAIGGALLGNNAIRDIALSRLRQLGASVTAASEAEGKVLDDVLQKVRAKTRADTIAQADAPQGNWFSRLFAKRPPPKA